MTPLNKGKLVDFVEIKTLDEEGIEGGIWSDQTRIGIQANGSRWLLKLNTDEESDEVVVYQLAQRFFDGIVPETHMVDLNGKLCSAQRMVTGKTAHELEEEGTIYEIVRDSGIIQDLGNMIVMDFMIGNPDRHGNNWIVMDNGRIAAIDNGFAAQELDMPINRALRPAWKCLMADDCARTPTLIGIIRSIISRIDGKEEEANQIVEEFSVEQRHLFIGKWQFRVEELKLRVFQWSKELDQHCGTA